MSLSSIPNFTNCWPLRKGAQGTSATTAILAKVSALSIEVVPSVKSIASAKLSGACLGISLNSVMSSIPSPSVSSGLAIECSVIL